jgi:hypothetical protein
MSAPVPLCYTHVFADGSWGGIAFGIFEEPLADYGQVVEYAIRHMIERPLASIPAIAVRMSDGSLVIVRPKPKAAL